MGIPTRLTIQDYFKQRANPCFQPKKCNSAAMDADAVSGDASFLKALSGAQTLSAGKAKGLSIRDYMQRRIPSHRPAAMAKVSCSAFLQPPIAPSPTVTTADHHTASNTKALQKASLSGQAPQENTQVEDKRKILASIEQAATQFGLPAALIKAVVKAESNYQVRALSPAGAQGLMQLMPATAKELGVTDPFDIDQNIRGGAQYLRNMLDQFDGDLHLALSAYNAGPGTVARYAGNVPYAETRTYVQRVLRYTEQFSSPEVT
jgi:soluble lytic murein transglycosylase-like protein